MTLTTAMITVDTLDPAPLAAWWAEQVGAQVQETYPGEFLMVLTGSVVLGFQRVDDPTPGKNRVHLDLTAPDLDAEVTRLLESGAGLVDRRSAGDFQWVTLTDPDGNEFCVSGAHP
jgi:predicted enzyme related to lactoylglutathione lyase